MPGRGQLACREGRHLPLAQAAHAVRQDGVAAGRGASWQRGAGGWGLLIWEAQLIRGVCKEAQGAVAARTLLAHLGPEPCGMQPIFVQRVGVWALLSTWASLSLNRIWARPRGILVRARAPPPALLLGVSIRALPPIMAVLERAGLGLVSEHIEIQAVLVVPCGHIYNRTTVHSHLTSVLDERHGWTVRGILRRNVQEINQLPGGNCGLRTACSKTTRCCKAE